MFEEIQHVYLTETNHFFYFVSICLLAIFFTWSIQFSIGTSLTMRKDFGKCGRLNGTLHRSLSSCFGTRPICLGDCLSFHCLFWARHILWWWQLIQAAMIWACMVPDMLLRQTSIISAIFEIYPKPSVVFSAFFAWFRHKWTTGPTFSSTKRFSQYKTTKIKFPHLRCSRRTI